MRICLHAGNTREEVERLVDAMVGWARGLLEDEKALAAPAGSRADGEEMTSSTSSVMLAKARL